MRTSFKMLVGLAAVGVVATASSAFTATGLTATGTAAADQFVGGTIEQAVTGATINSIVYGYADAPANTLVDEITLTFLLTEDARPVTVAASGGSGGTFDCEDTLANSSVCTFIPAVAETGYVGLSSLAVTVS